MKQIRTVMVQPGKEACVKWLDLSITALDEAVSEGTGFHCHARLRKLKKNIYLLHAEENNTSDNVARKKHHTTISLKSQWHGGLDWKLEKSSCLKIA